MSHLSLTPSTELEVVNEMLRAVGESPVNTIAGTVTTDVTIALGILSAVNRAVQSKGWHFNTDYNVVLSRDASNEIVLGASIMSFTSPTRDLAIRGGKLYDRVTRGTTFTTNITDARTITLLEFEDLPEVARLYITEVCKRDMQQEVLGEVAADQRNRETEMKAWAALVDDESMRSKANMGTGTSDMFYITRKDRFVI